MEKDDSLSTDDMISICQKHFGFSQKDATKLVKYLKKWEALPLAPLKDRPNKLSIKEIIDIVVLTALSFKVLACHAINLIKKAKEESDKDKDKDKDKK